MKTNAKLTPSNTISKKEMVKDVESDTMKNAISEMGYNNYSFQHLSTTNPDLLMLITEPEAPENPQFGG